MQFQSSYPERWKVSRQGVCMKTEFFSGARIHKFVGRGSVLLMVLNGMAVPSYGEGHAVTAGNPTDSGVVSLRTPLPQSSPGRDALLDYIRQCVSNERAGKGTSPCVDLFPDFGIFKADTGSDHYLLLPTQKTTGIEDTSLLQPGAPNFFSEAWQYGVPFIRKDRKPIPREAIGLAINSIEARSKIRRIFTSIASIRK